MFIFEGIVYSQIPIGFGQKVRYTNIVNKVPRMEGDHNEGTCIH